MEIQHAQPSGLRAASALLTISVVGLWFLVPGIVILCGVLYLASIVMNDSGNVPQQVGPLCVRMLIFDVVLMFVLRYSIRTRRDLAQMLPRARTAMLVFGAVYLLIALCIVPFPFPDPLAVIPGALGVWWLIYFSRPATKLAFENHGLVVSAAPVEPPPAA